MNELALFAGAGGGLLATKHLLGWRTVCYVENGAYPVQVLRARIRDGLLDDAPIWDDARTFDGKPWRGCVDIVTAGFPCQPFSQAGKQHAERDERNLWPDTIRIIREVGPSFVLLENVTGLLGSGYFGRILADLAESRYGVRWRCLSAAKLGMHHKRDRVWILAHTSQPGWTGILRDHITTGGKADSAETRAESLDSVWSRLTRLEKELGEPSVFGADDGMAHRVDRLSAIGEGQVPAVVEVVWRLLNAF